MSSSTKSLTEGPLAKQILLVSLPLVLSNLLQVLFNMSDVAVVGRFAGSTALGSVGSTSIFVTLFTGFLIGLSNGINVLVEPTAPSAVDPAKRPTTATSDILNSTCSRLESASGRLTRKICLARGPSVSVFV